MTTTTARALGFFFRTDPAPDSKQPWLFDVVDVEGEDLEAHVLAARAWVRRRRQGA